MRSVCSSVIHLLSTLAARIAATMKVLEIGCGISLRSM